MDAGASGIERELAHRNAHTRSAQIAEAQDALAVGDHNDAHILAGPVAENLDNPPLVRSRDEHAPRPAKDVSILLAGLPHRRGVDDGHHLLNMVQHHTVEQGLVPPLEGHHVDISFQVIRFFVKVLHDAQDLLILGGDIRRQQSSQTQRVPLLVGEGRPFVQGRVVQQIHAGLAARTLNVAGHLVFVHA